MVFEAHRDAACPAVPFITITHARAHKSGQSFWSFCARVYPPVVRVSLSGEGAVDLLFLIEDRAREEGGAPVWDWTGWNGRGGTAYPDEVRHACMCRHAASDGKGMSPI